MKIETEDGQTFEGANATEVVREMYRAGWKRYDTKRDYMEDVAARINETTGFTIRTYPDGFIEDLATAGVIATDGVG